MATTRVRQQMIMARYEEWIQMSGFLTFILFLKLSPILLSPFQAFSGPQISRLKIKITHEIKNLRILLLSSFHSSPGSRCFLPSLLWHSYSAACKVWFSLSTDQTRAGDKTMICFLFSGDALRQRPSLLCLLPAFIYCQVLLRKICN